MEKRELGRTGHKSSIVAFGGAALWKVSKAKVDAAIECVLEQGVNHFDVAPTYGEAEIRLAPWMEKNYKNIFLACKTKERSKARAWEALKRSLDNLRVGHFDLYQLHAVDDLDVLNMVPHPG